jgi:DNA polymerase elongation subunit (family B)
MRSIILHIETEPLPVSELLLDAPEFKAASNIKDPAKIVEDIEKKKQKYISEAQFNEATAKICAVAFTDYESGVQKVASVYGGDFPDIKNEEDLLKLVKEKIQFAVETVTFRGVKFVYPFLARRAAVYGLNLFGRLYCEYHPGKLLEEHHRDLAKIWACGGLSHPETLKEVASILKIHTALSNVPYYQMVKNNIEEANTYLLNTLDVIEEIRERLR